MKKFILAIVAMGVFSSAQASFLIEPYLGMHFNSEAEQGSFDDDLSGVGMGARFGWQNLGLQFVQTIKWQLLTLMIQMMQITITLDYLLVTNFQFLLEFGPST